MNTNEPQEMELERCKEQRKRLISKAAEQDREIEELQLGKAAAERLNRMNVKVADRETDRADKAEADLANEKKLHQACMKAAEKQTAELSACKERARELAKEARDWMYSAKAARWQIFRSDDKVDYEAAERKVQALEAQEQSKEVGG